MLDLVSSIFERFCLFYSNDNFVKKNLESSFHFRFQINVFVDNMQGTGGPDPRRPERIVRYVSPKSIINNQNEEKKDGVNDDLTPDYMNVLGMIFSMCALMMR